MTRAAIRKDLKRPNIYFGRFYFFTEDNFMQMHIMNCTNGSDTLTTAQP